MSDETTSTITISGATHDVVLQVLTLLIEDNDKKGYDALKIRTEETETAQ